MSDALSEAGLGVPMARKHSVDAHQVTRDFEAAVAEYTGAPHVVCVNSCTMALLLAVAWHASRHPKVVRNYVGLPDPDRDPIGFARRTDYTERPNPPLSVDIPKRTYVGVPMSIIHAGGWPTFRDEMWKWAYQLKPLPVWDAARWFTSRMWEAFPVGERADAPLGQMVCVSFHATKTLGIEQGGAILLNDPEADGWLRRMRFDGRTAGLPVQQDRIREIGWHCYPNPSMSAQGLMRMAGLAKHNEPLPMSDYPDLSLMECFK